MNTLRRCASCGSSWFRVREGRTSVGELAGAVCVNNEGRIVGYSAIFECLRCGVVLDDAQQRAQLRLVVDA